MRWCVLKNYFIKMFLVPKLSHRITSIVTEFITSLRLYNSAQFVTFGEFYDKNISNLMIPDNSGIDYVRTLLFEFGFLVYWKIAPNYPAFSRFLQHLVYYVITKRSRQCCKKKRCDVRENYF